MYLKKVLKYGITKYFIFGMEGVLFFLISKQLGPEQLGFYGFYTLFFGYLFIFNLGSIYALNKELSLNNSMKEHYIISVIPIIIIGFFILIAFLYLLNMFNIFNNYLLNEYILLLAIWWLCFNIQNLIINVYRSSHSIDNVIKIEFFFSLTKFLIILIYLYFFNQIEVKTILISIIFSLFLNIILNLRVFNNLEKIDFTLIKHIVILGIGLLFYEIISILIISFDRFFISINYSPETMGIYTFAYTLNNFIFLLVNSISFIIFPKILMYLKNMNTKYIKLFFFYSTNLSFMFYLIFFIPSFGISFLIFSFYGEYLDSFFIFKGLLVSNLIYSLTFPISSYYISVNLHYKLVRILSLVLIFIIFSNFLILNLNIGFKWIGFVNIFSFLFYLFLLVYSLDEKFTKSIKYFNKLLINIIILLTIFFLYVLDFFELKIFLILISILFLSELKNSFYSFEKIKKLMKKVEIK